MSTKAAESLGLQRPISLIHFFVCGWNCGTFEPYHDTYDETTFIGLFAQRLVTFLGVNAPIFGPFEVSNFYPNPV